MTQHDYKADRERLEKLLDGRTHHNGNGREAMHKYEDMTRQIAVTQDGADFYFELAGGSKPVQVQMVYPRPVADWDMKGAREARTWFMAEVAKRYPGLIPIFHA